MRPTRLSWLLRSSPTGEQQPAGPINLKIKTMSLSTQDKMQAFRDATEGKVVKMTAAEVSALVGGIDADTHDEAVNEILIELGWENREAPVTLDTRICDALDTIATTTSQTGLVKDQYISRLLEEAEGQHAWDELGRSDESTLRQLFHFLDYRSIKL